MKYIFGIVAFFVVFSAVGQIEFVQKIRADEEDAEQIVATMDLTNTHLTFGYKDGKLRYTGLRFTEIEIPKDSEILSAYVQFWAGANSVTENRSFDIYGHDTAYSLPFTMEDSNISDRIITSNAVLWEPGPWIEEEHGENQKTPNISAIIQEIIDNEDWASGNPLMLILQGSSPSSGYVEALAFDEIGITFAVKLTITYQEASAIDQPLASLQWRIQPNPVTNQFSINMSNMDSNPVSIQLFDILGSELNSLYNGPIDQSGGKLIFSVEKMGLKRGIYFIVLQHDNMRQTQKIVVN